MRERMKLLIGLQECDLKIKENRIKLEDGPRKIEEIEEELKALETDSEKVESTLEATKKEKRELDGKIDQLENTIKKSHAKLSSSKTNKEYRSALKEIEELGREKATLEDGALELMEEIERLEKQRGRSKDELEKAKKEVQRHTEEIRKDMKNREGEIEDLKRQKEDICLDIDGDILRRYNFLQERKNGVAVSPVIDGVCQACHMGIPPQRFNEVIRGDTLLTCPNCNRIIYWGENEEFRKVASRG